MVKGTPRMVKVLLCPTLAPAATARKLPLLLKVQNKAWKFATSKLASFLVTISLYL